MISRLKPYFKIEDILQIFSIKHKYEEIQEFENVFAKLADQSQAIFFPYGRTAQLAILNALKLSKTNRTEVILPSYTCVVVAHAIKKAGLEPVFVDVGEDYNMRIDLLLQATTKKTGAVIITSVFGHPADLEALDAYKQTNPKIFILQDCAHSFFAQHNNGRFVHKSGLCAFYGLNISKIITSIFGGMVTTDDNKFAKKLRDERQKLLKKSGFITSFKMTFYFISAFIAFNPSVYKLVNKLERSGYLNRFTKYYNKDIIDWPNDGFYWPAGIQARIGKIQCSRYLDIVNHRRKISKIYHNKLQNIQNFKLPPCSKGATISHFVVKTDRAEMIEKKLLCKGYQIGRLIDYEVPDMPIYQNAIYYGNRLSRSLPNQVINLPVHNGVTPNDALDIVKQVQSCMNKNNKLILIIGDDKLGRNAIKSIHAAFPEIMIYRDCSSGLKRIFKLLMSNTIPLSALLNILWAELKRPRLIKPDFPNVHKNSEIRDILVYKKPLKVICFRAGLILTSKTLACETDFLNLHYTNLPKWSGLGTVYKALRVGDYKQNACLHKIEEKIDSGKVYYREPYTLDPSISYSKNEERAFEAGLRLLHNYISKVLG